MPKWNAWCSAPKWGAPASRRRIYGCDDCQLCCPWNRFARIGDPGFAARNGMGEMKLVDLFAWDAQKFETRLADGPIRRIGHECNSTGPVQQWLRAHAGHFFVWRLLLYAATVTGWVWMRRRLLRRLEIVAVLAIVALEISRLPRD